MSVPQLLTALNGVLADPVLGLTARTTALAAGDPRIQTAFTYAAWALDGGMRIATRPNVMVRPRLWMPATTRADGGHRDARGRFEIGYEFFGAVLADIQDNVAIVATALAQVLDSLREYSDLHGGTVIEIEDGTQFDFGQFTGPTSHGFIATVTIIERSAL